MKLIYEDNGSRQVLEFSEAKKVTVGREKGNVLQLNHRSISKQHCELTLNKGQIEIKDLGSSNGTYINGDKVNGSGNAGAGDSLRIGHVMCSLEGDADLAQASEMNSGGTMIDENFGQMIAQETSSPKQEGFGNFSATGSPSSSPSAASSPVAVAAMPMIPEDKICKIKVISGAPAQTIPLRQPIVTIGTDPNCIVVLDSPGISAKHAEIVQENGKYIIRDLNSKNGIYINREKAFEKSLNHGDSIQICGVRLAFDSSAIGGRKSKLVPLLAGVIGLILLGSVIIKVATKGNEGQNVTDAGSNPMEKYKNLINKSIESIEYRRYTEAHTFIDEAKRNVPQGSSGALANTLKNINTNFFKENEISRTQLEELQEDLKKVISLVQNEKWEQPKNFASTKLIWVQEQIKFSELIGEAQSSYGEGKFKLAIDTLKKIPKESILYNAELENRLIQWIDEHEARLLREAETLMKEGKFRQAIPILDEAQLIKKKYNTEVVRLREVCQANMEAATLLEEAKDRYKKQRYQDAVSKLAKIPSTSLVFEEASKLKKEIYLIQVKDQILDNYKSGNGEEALRLLKEVDNPEMEKLAKKIESILSYFEKVQNQINLTNPDRGIIRDNCKAIMTLEEDVENYYYKEAKSALETYDDINAIANKILARARKNYAEKNYAEAKKAIQELIELSDLPESSDEKKEAKALIDEIAGRIAGEYLRIINSKDSAAEKTKELKELLKGLDKTDKYYTKIQKQIEKYDAEKDE
ncbi:MAG: FHA domain-containing protein [Planctomycetota bacterium]